MAAAIVLRHAATVAFLLLKTTHTKWWGWKKKKIYMKIQPHCYYPGLRLPLRSGKFIPFFCHAIGNIKIEWRKKNDCMQCAHTHIADAMLSVCCRCVFGIICCYSFDRHSCIKIPSTTAKAKLWLFTLLVFLDYVKFAVFFARHKLLWNQKRQAV